MKRGVKILRNAIRCKQCGEILESKYTHDFQACKCFKESGGTRGVACDGGLSYLRRTFQSPNDYENLSETRPFTDEEAEEYNKRKHEVYDPYGWEVDEME